MDLPYRDVSVVPIWASFMMILLLAVIFIALQLWYVFFIRACECIVGRPIGLIGTFILALIVTLIIAGIVTWGSSWI